MLTPMPLAITLGAGSTAKPYLMPAVENINGQAITLAMKHKDKRDPKQWKGMNFAVPFDYSMHNFLLRYYVARHGFDPDRTSRCASVPTARDGGEPAGRQPRRLPRARAVQPACSLRGRGLHPHADQGDLGRPPVLCLRGHQRIRHQQNPNTYRSAVQVPSWTRPQSAQGENRKEMAEAIAPTNYLNQPDTVMEQVLTGRYADGWARCSEVPDRIDFDPFPWHSMAVWILTQMKRWGYIEGDLDYRRSRERVYLAADAEKMMKETGHTPPKATTKNYTIMGKTFDPAGSPSVRRELRHQAEDDDRSLRRALGPAAVSLLLLSWFSLGRWDTAGAPTKEALQADARVRGS